jgi:hypothetical protein
MALPYRRRRRFNRATLFFFKVLGEDGKHQETKRTLILSGSAT